MDEVVHQTIRTWAESYESVYFYPYKPPPPRDAPLSMFDGNTTNVAYPHESITYISRWDITHDLVAPFDAILNLPYPDPYVENALQPVRQWHQDNYICPFQHEDCLTGRLHSTVFEDLSRVLKYISLMVRTELRHGKELFPHRFYTPLFTEYGSCAKPHQLFLPDRCALSNFVWAPRDPNPESGPVLTPLPVTRCPGEIKPSFKFRARWAPDDQTLSIDDPKPVSEYKKVMAQTKFYMRNCGRHSQEDAAMFTAEKFEGMAPRYGYVITDEEVVLLLCESHHERHGLQTTLGFPLRPGAVPMPLPLPSDEDRSGPEPDEDNDTDEVAPVEESSSHLPPDDHVDQRFQGFRGPQVKQAIGSGMLALILIHLLAANDDSLY